MRCTSGNATPGLADRKRSAPKAGAPKTCRNRSARSVRRWRSIQRLAPASPPQAKRKQRQSRGTDQRVKRSRSFHGRFRAQPEVRRMIALAAAMTFPARAPILFRQCRGRARRRAATPASSGSVATNRAMVGTPSAAADAPVPCPRHRRDRRSQAGERRAATRSAVRQRERRLMPCARPFAARGLGRAFPDGNATAMPPLANARSDFANAPPAKACRRGWWNERKQRMATAAIQLRARPIVQSGADRRARIPKPCQRVHGSDRSDAGAAGCRCCVDTASVAAGSRMLATVRAVHRTTREPADQCALDLLLQVEHDVVMPVP